MNAPTNNQVELVAKQTALCQQVIRDGALKVIEAVATASRFPSLAKTSIEDVRKALAEMEPAAELLASCRHDDPEYRRMDGESRARKPSDVARSV